MQVRKEITKLLKPSYDHGTPPPPSTTNNVIPLSVFDKVSCNSHVAVIFAYRPPTQSNFAIEMGLQKTLAVYREWAGRLGSDDMGNPVIVLNDEGIRFVEASVDCKLDQVNPSEPSASLLCLHPGIKDDVVELMQVQLTRFTCGSLVVGVTSHHGVADGNAASKFYVALGQACRGVEMSPLPFRDRTIFSPRKPPSFEFEHREVEFMTNKKLERYRAITNINVSEDTVVHKVHFTSEFLSKLKVKASSMNGDNKTCSTFESLVAHLWRSITKARALGSNETTQIRISVNGRTRLLNPKVPDEYSGNLVLWAFPRAKVKDLLREPVSYAAKLIHNAVAKVNNNYFKSFIDFASYKAKAEGLVPTAELDESVNLCPNLEVDSWLRFPFYEMDLGRGCPYIFMPSYYPVEGMIFLLPSFIRDGSIDAFIPMFRDNLTSFEQDCYSLD